ncbi:unnamed protein product [Lampetra planeri]
MRPLRAAPSRPVRRADMATEEVPRAAEPGVGVNNCPGVARRPPRDSAQETARASLILASVKEQARTFAPPPARGTRLPRLTAPLLRPLASAHETGPASGAGRVGTRAGGNGDGTVMSRATPRSGAPVDDPGSLLSVRVCRESTEFVKTREAAFITISSSSGISGTACSRVQAACRPQAARCYRQDSDAAERRVDSATRKRSLPRRVSAQG